jgi:hypothetical protein
MPPLDNKPRFATAATTVVENHIVNREDIVRIEGDSGFHRVKFGSLAAVEKLNSRSIRSNS